MAGGGGSSISAGFGHGRGRGEVEEGRGEVAQLRTLRVRAGWRARAGRANGGELCLSSACTEEEGEERDGTGRLQGARDDKDGARMTRIAGARSPTRG
jgi:hypothetical protein